MVSGPQVSHINIEVVSNMRYRGLKTRTEHSRVENKQREGRRKGRNWKDYGIQLSPMYPVTV